MAYVCYRYHTSLEMGPLMGGCTVAQLFQLHTAPQRSKGGMAYWAAGVEGYKACGKGLDSTPTWCVCVCVCVCVSWVQGLPAVADSGFCVSCKLPHSFVTHTTTPIIGVLVSPGLLSPSY